MTYRISQIEISDDDPFKHDALGRKESVELVASIVERTGERPLVLAIDAPYGSGKSTFIKMLRSVLMAKNFHSVEFNAWQVDHVSDPLVAMVASLDEAMVKGGAVASTMRASLNVVRKVTTVIAKQGVVAAAKALTMGAVDLSDAYAEILGDLAENATSDLVGAFQRETELIERFRSELGKAVAHLSEMKKKKTLIFFIDELDRCRPDFAITLLERIKHMFDVPNLVFVLSIDKAQLEASTAAVYGERINAAEYLRKFIDLEFGLPQVPSKRFVDMTVTRAGMDEVFAARGLSDYTSKDRDHFVRFLSVLADIKGLSLRAQERCITRTRVVLDQTLGSQYLDPILVALLVVIRLTDQAMFNAIAEGRAAPDDILNSLRVKPSADALLKTLDGRVLRAALIAEDWDSSRRETTIRELKEIINSQHEESDRRTDASHMVDLINSLQMGTRRPGKAMEVAVARVDLAANLRE